MTEQHNNSRGGHTWTAPWGTGIISAIGAYYLIGAMNASPGGLIFGYLATWFALGTFHIWIGKGRRIQATIAAAALAGIGTVPALMDNFALAIMFYLVFPHLLALVAFGTLRPYRLTALAVVTWLIASPLLLFAAVFAGFGLAVLVYILAAVPIATLRRRLRGPKPGLAIFEACVGLTLLTVLLVGVAQTILGDRLLLDWPDTMAGAAALMAFIVRWGPLGRREGSRVEPLGSAPSPLLR